MIRPGRSRVTTDRILAIVSPLSALVGAGLEHDIVKAGASESSGK